jgi:regulatory protein
MAESTLFNISLSKAMALCSRREYCADDILIKLKSWGVDDLHSEKIIDTLVREKFIDEVRYAAAFARDKFTYNKWGRIKISAHLKSKRIPLTVIRAAIESIDDDLYIKTLRDLLSSHRRVIKAKNQYDLKGKLLRYGLSKGFENGLLFDLLNETE